MEGWQPIETAPKDGTAVLLCQASDADGEAINGESWGVFVQVAAWWEDAGWGRGDADWVVYCNISTEPRLHFKPTHWMPLPANPLSAAT